MRTLHVAALPFPSPQGTQGLLSEMLAALTAAGHDTHLLCYAHGAHDTQSSFTVHRISAQGFARSLRSGPSLDKLWLDLSLARRLASLVRELSPVRVVAHHVEAAAVALALGIEPLTFIAHTSLREELPVYLSSKLLPLARWLGQGLDECLLRTAARSFAVSPLLAELLARQSGALVSALPLPWPVAAPITEQERSAARASLGLSAAHEVALYAGNLDAYQGLEPLLPALQSLVRARPQLRLLVATEASSSAFAAQLHAHGVSTLFAQLVDEPARRRAHAAADLALVPRRSAGGVPIKLLDAFSRGVPVVAAELALAGLPVAAHCEVVRGAFASDWQHAISTLLDSPAAARARTDSARAYLAREHAPGRFVAALCDAIGD